MAEILWTPSPRWVAGSHLQRFMDRLPRRFDTYHDLWRWSVTERGEFWEAVWDYAEIVAGRPPDRPIGTEAMPEVNQPIAGTIGYHVRTGKHDVTEYDWQRYMDFADKHLP